MSIFGLLFIGLVAGWLASLINNSGGVRMIIDLLIGVVAALFGGVLIQMFAFQNGGFYSGLVTAALSAILALFAVGLVKRYL